MSKRTEHSAAPEMATSHVCQVLKALYNVPFLSLLDLCVQYGSRRPHVVVEYLAGRLVSIEMCSKCKIYTRIQGFSMIKDDE